MSDFNQISVGNVLCMAHDFLSECSDSIRFPKGAPQKWPQLLKIKTLNQVLCASLSKHLDDFEIYTGWPCRLT